MSYKICPECEAAAKIFCPRNVDGRCLECGIELCAAHLMIHFQDVHCMTLDLVHCTLPDGANEELTEAMLDRLRALDSE